MSDGLALNWRRIPERYAMKGNHCTNCKQDYFPSRMICPNCRRKGHLVSKDMPRIGKIVSYTKVMVGPSGFENEGNYYLALIDLGSGAKVLSQIVDSDEQDIHIGASVKKMFRKIGEVEEKGAITYGYKFKVVKPLTEDQVEALKEKNKK
ncbi:MAG: Zn-ribbon domain-containing OB-fold protein [Candidatus Diapherotrites archaeon]|nr:Zn-ribbon domain-containing OB-fold protein [Candidatus Diapherotrites archaeon]